MEDNNKTNQVVPGVGGAEEGAPQRRRPAEPGRTGENEWREAQGRKVGGLRQQSKKRSGQGCGSERSSISYLISVSYITCGNSWMEKSPFLRFVEKEQCDWLAGLSRGVTSESGEKHS
ncbi:hypothetical protein TNCT_738721 [Trichonephila clavata]|uniref:Uncharacterized protein n=1 Tax=Trichonephila clavata TaxID=2740835 RepID=A0A8X6H1I5_TRICU|nr:hypothetical protein TNCT_738721 [Trichonephila clavata]